MRGRVFDTKTSRFLTPDPLIADPSFSPSLNRFAYVNQSPLNWVDPTGFEPEDTRRGMNVWGGSVNGGAATSMSSTGIGVGTVDPGLVQDVATGIAGMHFPAGSDAVNSSGCPTGTGKTPRPCAGASQGGCPSGNAKTDSWSLTNSWGFRFAKGAAVEAVTGAAVSAVRFSVAIGTAGTSEIIIQTGTRAYAAYEGYRNGGVLGAAGDAYNVGNPIYHVGEMGARLYLAIDGENPEKIGAASLPVAMAVVGAVAGRFAGGGSPKGVIAGEAGQFADLQARSGVGDGLSLHHMPQVALKFTARAEGGAMVLWDAEHALTRTFKARGAAVARNEADLGFRDVLVRDIRDVRRIAGPKYDAGLRQLLQYYQTQFPELMRR
jgi:hypothetical protein